MVPMRTDVIAAYMMAVLGMPERGGGNGGPWKQMEGVKLTTDKLAPSFLVMQ